MACLSGTGGFATHVLATAALCMPLPDGFSHVDAAAFIMIYATSHHALIDRAQLQAGETVLVLGAPAGGVGTAAIQIAKARGARVIAAASTEEKCALCLSIGADAVINYAQENLREAIKALTDGRGPDVIYDPVGGEYTDSRLPLHRLARSLPGGGLRLGAIPSLPLNLPAAQGRVAGGRVSGAISQARAEGQRGHDAGTGRWFAEGKVKPVIDRTMPMSQLKAAHEHMGSRGVIGKLVMVN